MLTISDALFSELSESYDQCRLEYFGDALQLRPFADRRTSSGVFLVAVA